MLGFQYLGQLVCDRCPVMLGLFGMQASGLAAHAGGQNQSGMQSEVEVSPQQWAIWTLKGRMQNTKNQTSGTLDMYQQIGPTDALIVQEISQK